MYTKSLNIVLRWFGPTIPASLTAADVRKAEDQKTAPSQPSISSRKAPAAITQWNLRDSDGTVIFSLAKRLSGGSLKTLQFAIKHRKPYLHLPASKANAASELKKWIQQNNIRVLNVAGPPASKEPEVGKFAAQVLDEALAGGDHAT
jgi:hypothetical protein